MKDKPSKRIKAETGRGTATARYKKVGGDYIERSNAYSAHPRAMSHAKPSTKAAITTKAKPKKFSVTTTRPRSGMKSGTGYKTNYGL